MIGGLIAAGLATVNIGKECGKYCYNNHDEKKERGFLYAF